MVCTSSVWRQNKNVRKTRKSPILRAQHSGHIVNFPPPPWTRLFSRSKEVMIGFEVTPGHR